MKDFKCNKSDMSMESYLRGTALADQRKRRSTTYVWHDENGVLAGYVTIAISRGHVKTDPDTGESYDDPLSLLDMIARREGSRYKGAGAHVPDWVVGFAREMSEYVGCSGVMLYTNNDGVVEFYRGRGFELLGDSSRVMFCDLGPVHEGRRAA